MVATLRRPIFTLPSLLLPVVTTTTVNVLVCLFGLLACIATRDSQVTRQAETTWSISCMTEN
jgi:hypothetical protein